MGLPHQLLPQGGLAERFRGSECAMKVWVMQRPDESASEKTFTAGTATAWLVRLLPDHDSGAIAS